MQQRKGRTMLKRLLYLTLLLALVGCGSGASEPEATGEPDGVEPGVDLELTTEAASTSESAEATEVVENTDFEILEDGELRIEQVDADSNFVLIDNFDSHYWVDSEKEYFQRGTFEYSDKHHTQGENAWHIIAPLSDLGEGGDLARNTVEFGLKRELPIGEDWSKYDFATFDIYMEENPTGLSETRLCLENSDAKQACAVMILGWQLFQWDNRQMTFPLKGNAHIYRAIPDEILSDVRRVYLAVYRYSDQAAGDAEKLDQLNFHIDNFRLDGSEAWDVFDGPALDWSPVNPVSTAGGQTHTRTYAGSAGALYLGWDQPVWQPGEFPTVNSGEFDSVLPKQATDWSDINYIRAKVYAPERLLPLEFNLLSGASKVRSSTAIVERENEWVTLTWKLPVRQPGFDYANVSGLELVMPSTADFPAGEVWLDFLEIGQSVMFPSDVEVRFERETSFISWRNPDDPRIDRVFVWASRGGYPQGPEDGEQVCSIQPEGETNFCDHFDLKPGEQWFYTVAGRSRYAYHYADSASLADGTRSMFTFSPPNAKYEVAFNRENGGMIYLMDLNSGKTVSQGSVQDDLWKIVFYNETDFPTLRSSDFSADSETMNFAIDASQNRLVYRYNKGGKKLELAIALSSVDENGFDMKVTVDNQTGEAIRTVSAPHRLGFLKSDIQRVLYPIQEGLVLLPDFFEENRTTYLARPPLFADILAVDSKSGDFAVYMIQDSLYHADIIPQHEPTDPVFQPNNLELGGAGDYGYMSFDMVTFIPSGQTWESGTLRVRTNRTFRQLASHYRTDNGFDDRSRYPTLEDKLNPFGFYDDLANSPIMAIELFKVIDWLKAPRGDVWGTIETKWLKRLPSPSVLHLTHWQYGRDWYDEPLENHKLEDDHPEALPIWWSRYGSEEDLLSLIETAGEEGFLTMPFTNWTVWNTVDPVTKQIPSPEQMPMGTRKIRGSEYPWYEYKGYMIEPWADEVRERNTQMFETYTRVYPQDIMFVDMTGERSWRYVLMDDGETASAAAYTQSVINENERLSKMKPLFTEGVFDQIANSITGYAQTLQQKFWNGILLHLGNEYEHWVPYPFAADVLHENVAFYQHDLNLEVWASEEQYLFTYYVTFGYNFMVDVSKHFGEDEYWIQTLDTFQKVVNSQTFGEPLRDYKLLTDDRQVVQTRWGDGDNEMIITASFHREGTEERIWPVDGFSIAPDGFFARTEKGDRLAGIFEGQFNGNDLSGGQHWITVHEKNGMTEIQQPQGENTLISVRRPDIWVKDSEIQVVREMYDGTYLEGEIAIIGPKLLTVNYENKVGPELVRKYILFYGPDRFSTIDSDIYLNSIATSEDDKVSFVQFADLWRLTPDSIPATKVENTNIESAGEGRYLIEKTSDDSQPRRFETETMRFAFNRPLILTTNIVDISLSDRIVFQLQEQGGNFETFDIMVAGRTFAYRVDLREITGWNEPRDFSIIAWLPGSDEPILVQELMVQVQLSDGDVAEEILAGTAAEEPAAEEVVPVEETPVEGDEPTISIDEFVFEDKLINYGWNETNLVLLTSEGGGLILSEDGPDTDFGRIESQPFTVPVLDELVIDLFVSNLTPGASYTVQLQEDEGDYRSFDIYSGEAPNSLALNLKEMTGWRGEKTFRFVVWLSGEGSEITLDRLTIRPAEEASNEGFSLAEVQPVWWEETFDPLTNIWQTQDIATEVTAEGAMRLTVTNENVDGPFGKYESDIITADLDSYPLLEIDISAVQEATSYSIQIQEEGGLYRNFDAVNESVPAKQTLDLRQITGWEGEKSFRVLIWVTGESVDVDNVRLKTADSE